ncbi:MAG TPA: hypothetical protein VJ787_13055 [Thermoleophilia bacterium]|nr:hypothetical protein [Thermoleophilia bacterium]
MSDQTDDRTVPLPEAGGAAGVEDTEPSGDKKGGWHAVAAWSGDRSAGRSGVRLRRWLVGILVVLAVIGVLISSVTLWAHNFLLDTDKWVETVAPIAKDPQVTHDLSVYLAQRGVDAIDIQQRAENLLPSQLQPLAEPLSTAIEDGLERFLQENINEFLNTPAAYNLWVEVNRVAHEQVVNALEDKPGALSINNGQAQLNLLPLLSKALIQVQQRAPRLLSSVSIPEISPETPPAEANQQLSQALGIQLPSDFGQVTLLKSQDLETAQQWVHIFNVLVVLIVIVTIALITAAVWLSLNRRRTLMELGIGVGLALIISRVVVNRIEENVVNGLKTGEGPGVAGPILRTAIDNLQGFTLAFLIAGIVVAVGAFLVGKPQWLTRAGHGVAVAGEAGAGAASAHRSGMERFVVAYTDWLRIAGVVVALLILLLTTPGWGWIITIVVVLLGWEVLIRYLVYHATPPDTTGV